MIKYLASLSLAGAYLSTAPALAADPDITHPDRTNRPIALRHDRRT
ncbi:hypothetical protein JQ634_03940 [Bradyrhizobium sp. AUGA SZCCT0240]|jgi:hypothetical protein|nr:MULTISPECIES: hypothetical protein [unclassified Bradyrhizobium]MBR1192080.1 hypothetical protein [Bradyrhizobium sp. AUGA SZCCT0160]MBR1194451.1 hypothetical protein [Bradyrhizobium sp. AUGA SZCCT0158]MBR1245083.1 hypothetical protein [Bradyrhizobium sp. AUGA SZCCT0274]MBR1252016.1 hypothetical protein [Bradyrhizobium sp. AUGA SZCCT0169]MBR1252845.1 hypothetical protein [Bradyrhizobium sp. AUGA SZCCT0240]